MDLIPGGASYITHTSNSNLLLVSPYTPIITQAMVVVAKGRRMQQAKLYNIFHRVFNGNVVIHTQQQTIK
jgi:hypothetical protein